MTIAPLAENQDPLIEVRQLEKELAEFDAGLLDKPRWLAFTKADLLEPEEASSRAETIIRELGWENPWAVISSVTQTGTMELMQQIMLSLDEKAEIEQAAGESEMTREFDMPESPPEQ